MNWKRIVLGLFLLAGMLGVLALGLSAYVVSSTRARVLEAEAPPPEDLDCILVLGCGVRPDAARRLPRAVKATNLNFFPVTTRV